VTTYQEEDEMVDISIIILWGAVIHIQVYWMGIFPGW
jgi:hypothetical protein